MEEAIILNKVWNALESRLNQQRKHVCIPVCNCINICPRELERAVKDPRLVDSLNSATWRKTEEGASNIALIVEAEVIRA